jgi:hypothetical protein
MDLSWCPVCDKQVFAINSLYCSEACQHKDASSLPSPSSLSDYTFPRRSSPKGSYSLWSSTHTTPYASPSDSLLSPSLLCPPRGNNYFEAHENLSSSPEDLLLSSRNVPRIHNDFRGRDEIVNNNDMCLTLIHASTATVTETIVTTIMVETREVQPALPTIKKKRSFVENAWRMLFA